MNKIISRLGIDKAIRYVILGKGISILSGLIIMLLISAYMSQDAQGYYYTFNSVVALQIIFELGLSAVIIQFASHEMAGMEYDYIEKKVTGDENNKQRYLSLFNLALKWYGAIGLLIVCAVGPVGYYFFSHGNTNNIDWEGPWIVLTLSTAINVFLISILSIAEGSGLVASVNKMRMIQALLAAVLSVILLLSGEGLYATSALAISGTIVFSFFSYKYFKSVHSQAKKQKKLKDAKSISWRQEILPMQWRIALSWMAGYFIFFIMTPIAFKYFGAAYAGQLGMSLTLCNMIMATGLAWISTKYPSWGVMVSKGERAKINKSFYSATIQSVFFVLFSLVGAIGCLCLFQYYSFSFVERFLDLESFIYLSLAILGNHLVACLATYIRAHKMEKMTTASCIMAVLTFIAMLMIAYNKQSGLYVMVYALIVWGYFVPQTYFIFKKFKRNYE